MSHPSWARICVPIPGPLALTLALGLAGCASAPDHFHTLLGAATPPATAASAAPMYVEVLAVSVPEQVQRKEMVVTGRDGRIDLLEHERWAGALDAEVGRALSLGVTGQLGAIDVYRTPYPAGATVYRISTNVQRFDSVLDRYALVDAVWSVRQLKSGAVLTCRSVVRQDAGGGYDGLVAGHRQALDKVASNMATAVRSIAADGRGACPATGA
jgi:uncharacterized lipoprotein YmbA